MKGVAQLHSSSSCGQNGNMYLPWIRGWPRAKRWQATPGVVTAYERHFAGYWRVLFHCLFLLWHYQLVGKMSGHHWERYRLSSFNIKTTGMLKLNFLSAVRPRPACEVQLYLELEIKMFLIKTPQCSVYYISQITATVFWNVMRLW